VSVPALFTRNPVGPPSGPWTLLISLPSAALATVTVSPVISVTARVGFDAVATLAGVADGGVAAVVANADGVAASVASAVPRTITASVQLRFRASSQS
jgi:hypothetical protein